MSNEDKAKFTAQFYGCKFTKDGGGRLTLDFGNQDIKEVQKIQEWAAFLGEVNLMVVAVPYVTAPAMPQGGEFVPDQNGEIPI